MEKKSVFETLAAVSVAGHVEKIGKLSYLSWAWAWALVKSIYPEATYTIYENRDGLNYHTDGRTCWVKTGVTIEGMEHIEYLPVMDNTHKSIPLERVTSFSVNTAIQRSLTKAIARHGLGLNVYAGEDLLLYEEGSTPAPAPAEKPVVAEGNERWAKCIKYITANNINPDDLLKQYTISEQDLKTLHSIVDFRKDLFEEGQNNG